MVTEYYQEQLKNGEQYQDFVGEVLYRHGIVTVAYGSKPFQYRCGENKARIEIKLDNLFKKTGNLYIEIAEKSHPNNTSFVSSGIYRDCVEYVIGDYDTIYRFSSKILRGLHGTKKHREVFIPMGTSQGFLLPKDMADRYSTDVYHVNCAEFVDDAMNTESGSSHKAKLAMANLMARLRGDHSSNNAAE